MVKIWTKVKWHVFWPTSASLIFVKIVGILIPTSLTVINDPPLVFYSDTGTLRLLLTCHPQEVVA